MSSWKNGMELKCTSDIDMFCYLHPPVNQCKTAYSLTTKQEIFAKGKGDYTYIPVVATVIYYIYHDFSDGMG